MDNRIKIAGAAVAIVVALAMWFFYLGPGSVRRAPEAASTTHSPEVEAARQAQGESRLGTAGNPPQAGGGDTPVGGGDTPASQAQGERSLGDTPAGR